MKTYIAIVKTKRRKIFLCVVPKENSRSEVSARVWTDENLKGHKIIRLSSLELTSSKTSQAELEELISGMRVIGPKILCRNWFEVLLQVIFEMGINSKQLKTTG